MLRTFKIEAAAICGVLALACPAKAATLSCQALRRRILSGTTMAQSSLVTAPTVDYTAVQQQSELWSNFTMGPVFRPVRQWT